MCAPVSERCASSCVFLSLLPDWVVEWPDPHFPICGLHLPPNLITFRIIIHRNSCACSFAGDTYALFVFGICLLLFFPHVFEWPRCQSHKGPPSLSKEFETLKAGKTALSQAVRQIRSQRACRLLLGFLNTCLSLSFLLRIVTCLTSLMMPQMPCIAPTG